MSFRGEKVSNGFVHSVKVPRIYKTASSIIKRVVENGESLKQLVYNTRHKNIKGVYALVVETIKHERALDNLIKKSKLLEKEGRLEPWLARILLTEMIFRKKELKGNSKPVQTVLSYREKLNKHLKGCSETVAQVKTPRYVRVNTLLQTVDEVIKIFRDEDWVLLPTPHDYSTFLITISELKEYEFTKDFHIKELLVFPSNAQFYNHELYTSGRIILQDKTSCLATCLLHPPPHSTALDMCAAPGMKTTHLSAWMRNKGVVYATEINSSRYQTLCDTVRNAGCDNVKTLNLDALLIGRDTEKEEQIDTSWYKDVEYILVDPSCSGSGIVERSNIFVNEKTDCLRLRKLRAFQFKLLHHALTGFPKIKRVVYSTCSIHSDENERVVEDVLRKLRDDSLDDRDLPHFELAEPLKDKWPRRGFEVFECGKFCIRAEPGTDFTNGFFIAVFERIFDKDRQRD